MIYKIENKLNPIKGNNIFALNETIQYLINYDDTNFDDYGGLDYFIEKLRKTKSTKKINKVVLYSYKNEITIYK